jgi:hypothetical protein
MDFENVIRDLYCQKQKLERVIAELEELHRATGGSPVSSERKRRGRTHMGDMERKNVSERMKAYWRKRRKAPNPSDLHSQKPRPTQH